MTGQARARLALFYVMREPLPDAGLKDVEVVFDNAGLTLALRSLNIDPIEA
jgi:hypothetical protein